MHSVTLGIVAAIDRSALTWHVRHSIWLSITCVLWGYAIGCGTRRAGQKAAAAADAISRVSTRAPTTYLRMRLRLFLSGETASLGFTRDARIVFADEKERGRAGRSHIFQRRVFPVRLDGRVLLPQRAAEPDVTIVAVVGCAVQRDPVSHPCPRRCGLESRGEGNQLVDEVAAGAP